MQFWQAISYAPPDQLVELARTAEAAGFTGVAIPDHIVTPVRIESRYPYTPDGEILWDPSAPYPEPWILAAVLAQSTLQLRFMTYVYILPLRDHFSAARSIATAAIWTGDRIVVGVGAGWMADEFRVIGRSFPDRGRRMDDMLVVIRKLLAGGAVEHHSEFFDFEPVQLAPVPKATVPIWVGGHSTAALYRAARLEGWVGVNYEESEIPPLLQQLAEARRRSDCGPSDFAITLAVNDVPDAALCRRLEDRGVTGVIVPSWLALGEEPSSLEHKRAGLLRFGERVISHWH
jgi:probable F420-dependent oxidoreductase